MNNQIAAIIVTYNNVETISRCLWSLKNQKGIGSLEIIMVDNASFDKTVSIAQELYVDEIIGRKENSGFAKAANEGARIASSQYLFFFNPDAELKSSGLLELMRAIEKDSKIAIVGGKFISAKGKNMVSFGRFPSFWTEIFQKTRLAKIFPFGRYIPYSVFSKHLFKKTHEVDWISGGFCLVRKEVFEKIEGFDENYFLYLEDVDLARRIKDKGYKIIFCPKATAVHYQKRSDSQKAKQSEKEGLLYYKEKFRIKKS